MREEKRGKVWLAVCGLVIDDHGRWLVVKKKYGGLKGKWFLPAGFVNVGETADEAVMREIYEETGIKTKVQGIIGLRTGVIKEEISDNMILFSLLAKTTAITLQEMELSHAAFIHPNVLRQDRESSVLLDYLLKVGNATVKYEIGNIDPGDQFGYTSYKIFL